MKLILHTTTKKKRSCSIDKESDLNSWILANDWVKIKMTKFLYIILYITMHNLKKFDAKVIPNILSKILFENVPTLLY